MAPKVTLASSPVPREVLRTRLAQLQAELRAALADKRSRIQAIVSLCRSERIALREQLGERRKQALDQVDHDVRAARAGARLVRLSRLAEARKDADSDIAAARRAVAVERQHREDLRRIDYEHRRRRADVQRQHEVTVQGAALHAAVLGHFAPLFQRVSPKVKPVPGESPAEALLRYAQTHPEEAHAAAEPRAEKKIAETRQAIAKTRAALRVAPRAVAPKAAKVPRAARATTQASTTSLPTAARGAARPIATPAAKPSLRRPGQLPKGGGGVLLEDFLRERAAIAAKKAGKPSGAAPTPKRAKPGPRAKKPKPGGKPPGSPAQSPDPKPAKVEARSAPTGAPRVESTVKAADVHDTAKLAALIRQDIKTAVAAGALPKATYSVRTDKYSMGSSIDVVASKLPFAVLNDKAFVLDGRWATFDSDHFRSRLTPEAQTVQGKLEAIVDAYHWDRSDPQTDYYNERFHKTVRLEDEGEMDRITKALLAKAEAQKPPPVVPPAVAAPPKAPARATTPLASSSNVIPLRPRKKPPNPQQGLFPETAASPAGAPAFVRGTRVRWAPAFLEKGRVTDPRWYDEHKSRLGTVDGVQRDGDVLVLWDGADTTTVHPPARLARA